MITTHTPESLIKFEEDVCDAFMNKEVRAPVHLYSNNETQMIEVFKQIREQDWCFCTWRSHYQCLLKGVPEDKLLEAIKDGKSISLNFPEYKIFSSAIVTGSIPIAIGVALANKWEGNDEHVYLFVGDMASETGSFEENYKYAVNHDLPITFVIENNKKSVCTETYDVWGIDAPTHKPKMIVGDMGDHIAISHKEKIIYYEYENKYPHAGTGTRIQF